MSTKYLYRCPKCSVVMCDPPTDKEGPHPDGRQLWVWCPVCKEWVEVEHIDSSQLD